MLLITLNLLTGLDMQWARLSVRLEVFVELVWVKGCVEELMDTVGETVLQDQFLFFFH